MTTQPYSELLKGDAIKTAITLRSHSYDTQSIPIPTLDSIEEFENTLPEGWEIEKKYKTTIRIRKIKPANEVFLDNVWLILAKMGFIEISSGNSVSIPFLDEHTNGLFDIFAKDDETALFVKCFDVSMLSINDLSDRISNYNGIVLSQLYKAVKNIYGTDCDLKIRMVVFLQNTPPEFFDKKINESPNVVVYNDKHLHYFNSLVTQLKGAARYQFLAYLFPNQKIKNLSKTVYATKGVMGKRTFYTFLIHPKDLLKISFVAHKANHMSNDVRAYQRMLKPKRLKDIAEFINDGGKFPTNIVVNLKSKFQFQIQRSIDEYTSTGYLTLPSNYASAWIIDGQHRLYGYAYAHEIGKIKNNKSLLPVMAFDNLTEEEEMSMFIDLNSKHVKVPPQILVELSADLHWGSKDKASAYQALISKLVLQLNSEPNSPFYDRMIVSGTGRTEHRIIGLESVNTGLRSSQLLGTVKQGSIIPGPFSTSDSYNYSKNLEKAYSIITRLFEIFRNSLPEYWTPNFTEEKIFSFFCTNIGVRALLMNFRYIAESIELTNNMRLNTLSVDLIISKFQPYIDVLVNYFQTTAVNDLITRWNLSSSSAALVTRHAKQLAVIIHYGISHFNPDWLATFIEDERKLQLLSCYEKVSKIEKELSEFIISKLQKEYGDDRNTWIVEGLPKELRKELTERREEENRQRDEERYLYFIEYRSICMHNWALFRDTIPLQLTSDIDNKKDATKWIVKMNSIRNKVSHATGEEVTLDDVNFVEDILNRVNMCF